MLKQQKQPKVGKRFTGGYREIGPVSADLLGLGQQLRGPKKTLDTCLFELPLVSIESKESSDCRQETRGGSDCDTSSETEQPKLSTQRLLRSDGKQEKRDLPIYMNFGEFEIGNNCYDMNNSGQGVDMQNLPSMAEQVERQRTWMTVYFRYRMNWYEAKPTLSKMSRETAYLESNLPLWTRCLKVQLNRKTVFLHAIRAFKNRMQCATSGVRFTVNAFYRESGRGSKPNEPTDGPEAKPLQYFKCPDDLPDIKRMVVAQINVFVSNSTSFFDQFWDEGLNEES